MPDPPMIPSTARVMTSPRSATHKSAIHRYVRLYCGAKIKHYLQAARESGMPTKKDREKRQSIIDACRSMNALGINQGTSGNISLRHGEGLLITPTSTPYEAMRPEQIVFMDMDGSHDAAQRPSSEWRFHLDILKARPEVNAVVHAHPTYSTILAIMNLEIPPIHYMIACAGGGSIRLAPYATFGTEEHSALAVFA